MKDVLAAFRIHIVSIAVCATVFFGFLFRGVYPWGLALLCGFDWCIVNLLNRATDVDEDRLNQIAATEIVAKHARVIVWGCLVCLVGSLVAGWFLLPHALAADRVVFHALGVGYSFRYVPTPRGWKRFKDLYVFKNTMSATMFVLSVIGYPLLGRAEPLLMSPAAMATLAVFFFLFEHSFEIIYDLRDLEGDRAVGVPTYPVVHGMATSARIVYALCAASIAVLLVARAGRVVLTREVLLAAAPAAQWVFLRRRGPERVTRADCIGITYAGAALLLFYLAGTALWARAGLPTDF
ncbi:MAG: UbiA family prenyltransferase [Deltaproteobacteria bacterium]